jgi:penicillin-insensitive murein DD-endopeptidase
MLGRVRRVSWRETLFGCTTLAGALFVGVPRASAQSAPIQKLPPQYQRAPYSLMSLSVGHPNQGWQLRAKRLRRSGHLKIKEGSEQRVYGHPALVLMLGRTSKQVARGAPGSVMLVGDLSSEQGGKLSGHVSHQSGRDADVGFYATDARGRAVVLDHFVAFAADGRAKDGSGLLFDDWRNWLLLEAWAQDRRAGLSHIFVATALKNRLLAWARRRPAFHKRIDRVAMLLKQPENSEPHDDHFHVRVSCPSNQTDICREESR